MTLTEPSADEIATGREGLPEGWELARLEEICSRPQYGWTTAAKATTGGLNLLRTTDISRGKVDWAAVPGCQEEPKDPDKYLLTRGDILISRAGSVGLSFLVSECPKAIFASYLIRFHTRAPILGEFVHLFLKTPAYWSAIAEESAGIAIPNVNASKLKRLEVPLPPLAEQRRIVGKTEELLARVNAARERLRRVPAILKRFRQAVLAAACSGRLTADWREGSGLDQDWDMRTLEASVVDIRNGYGRRPKGVEEGPIVLRLADVASGHVDLAEPRRVAIPPHELERYRVARGDLLFVRVNGSAAIVGRCILCDVEQPDLAFNDHLIRVRVDTARLLPGYAAIWANSQGARDQILARAVTTAGQYTVNHTAIQSMELPMPPLAEQREILRRVEALFKLADAIEKRVAAASTRAEKLSQAILAKAFRGELVPTEAELARREGRDYEPASVLLERIQREREVAAGDRRKRR